MFHKKWTSEVSQRGSDTQYALCMDFHVGGVWVQGCQALVKSPWATVSQLVGVCLSQLYLNINIEGKYHLNRLNFYNSIFDSAAQTEQFLLSPQRRCCVPSSASFLLHTPVQRSVAATPKWWTVGDEAYTTSPTRCIRTPKNCISRITESGGWDQWLSEKSPSSASLIYLITP